MTYCESCPIYNSCLEDYRDYIQWCWYRERKLVNMPNNEEIITKKNKKKVNK